MDDATKRKLATIKGKVASARRDLESSTASTRRAVQRGGGQTKPATIEAVAVAHEDAVKAVGQALALLEETLDALGREGPFRP